ncbi:amidase family protein [Aliidiomarina haloalkalitolerans]|uniref:amidase family protein n=1 Tax=Aliidiomarina haloalkalitolerans TaxID=859059 RepID=UPI001F546EE7|nr:amidase family protein [Aliidiomarina haloalkalitolerans]
MFTTKLRIFAGVTLSASLFLAACSPAPEVVQPADPAWTNAATAQQQLESGALTSVALVEHYLAAIAANNAQGYEIRAIIDVNPEALTIAAERDRERAAGQLRGQLHGLPVILKANIATADSMPTTAGAEVMQGFTTAVDAELVQQLRDEGAIILAKANLSEWANFRGQNSISGWSGLGGQTRNPHVLTHNPCGSSSGSGAAVAADFALLAIGTETDGSIMCPASINGVVGIKPTRGTVSGHGIIPIASAQDIAGPMTRYVYDAALLLDAMITPDAADQFGVSLARASQAPYSGEPVVLVRAWDERFTGVKELTDRTANLLRAQGIEVIEVPEWRLPPELGQAEFEVLIYEFQRDLNAWLAEFGAPEQAQDMNAIIAYNQANAERTLALFGQEYFEAAAALDLAEAEASYLLALSTGRELAEAHLDQYLKELGVAAIIMPSYGPAWPIPPGEGPGYSFGTSTAAAVSGYPSITVPSGREDVRPIGLSIIGLPYSEPQLLSLATLIEDVVGGFQRPQFLPELPSTDAE